MSAGTTPPAPERPPAAVAPFAPPRELATGLLAPIFEHLPAAVALFDRDMRYVLTTRRWRADYRLADADLTGRSHYEVFPEIPERWRAVHRRCLAGATESAEAEPFLRADGTMDWVTWDTRPWYGADGEIGGLLLWSEVVTERRKAEHLFERYRMLARHGRDIMLFVRRADGRIVEANDAALEAYGYKHEEMLGLRIQDVRAPGTQALTASQMEQADKAGVLFETVHRRKDGSEFPVEVSSQGATIGGVRVLLSVVRDTTLRTRAAQALAASESRYRQLVQLSPEPVIINRDHMIEYVNPAAIALFGARDASEVVGRMMLSFIPPTDHAAAKEYLAVLMSQDQPAHTESRIVRLDGTVRHVEVSGAAFTDERGTAQQFIARDVTDRKRLEAAQLDAERHEVSRHGEARFRALIENSADVLNVIDVDGRIQFWSPGAEAVLGWSEQDMVGRFSSEFVHPDDMPRAGGAFDELARCPGASYRHSLRMRHRNGSWRLLESVARNLLHDVDVRGIVVNSRDITEQHELQQRSLEAQKLESIGRLAGGVAHDFNNLLTAILGGVDAIDDAIAAGDGVQPEDVAAIRQAGGRARDLTRQLLSFARRQVITPVPLDLNALVLESEKLLRRLLPENVAIVTSLQDGLGRVLGDESQLQQVILNLAANARDAMPGGGRLGISTRASSFDGAAAEAAGLSKPCECVQLIVHDNGAGMSAEAREHLFEPFFTTKPQGQGTGLGLAAVYGIVQQNHGRITVESRAGHGTVIAIDLPCTDRTETVVEEGVSSPVGGNETVLLVEDEALVRDIMARALRKAGYRVLVVADPHDALAAEEDAAERIDLLVTDIVMPGLSGPQLAERLVAHHPDLKVLYVSGYTQDEIGHEGVLQADIEFLQKPFRMAALLTRVRAVLEAAPTR